MRVDFKLLGLVCAIVAFFLLVLAFSAGVYSHDESECKLYTEVPPTDDVTCLVVNPDDLMVIQVKPPIDPPPLDCEATPEADGCPCPAGEGWTGDVYPDCEFTEPPTPEPVDPCTKLTPFIDYFADAGAGGNLLDNDRFTGECEPEASLHLDGNYGVTVVNPDGTFTYTPNDPANPVEDKIRYRVTDPASGLTAVTSAWFFHGATVEPPEPPPVLDCDAEPETDGCPCPESDDWTGDVYPNCVYTPPEPGPEPGGDYPEAARVWYPPVDDVVHPEAVGLVSLPPLMEEKLVVTAERTVEDIIAEYAAQGVVAQYKPSNVTLAEALNTLAKATNREGGVILFDESPQCDRVNYRASPNDDNNLHSTHVAIRGLWREREFLDLDTGEKYLRLAPPRLYCRMLWLSNEGGVKINGTIPKDVVDKVGIFWTGGAPLGGSLTLDSFGVDGYKGAFRGGNTGENNLFRMNMHSGSIDGLGTANSGKAVEGQLFYASLLKDACDQKLTLWQSSVSHYGQGNFKHNGYFHTCIGGTKYAPEVNEAFLAALGFPSDASEAEKKAKLRSIGVFPDQGTQINFINSISHSPRWSSAIKAISNSVNIIGSRVCSTASVCGIRDGLVMDVSQAAIDLAMMANINVIDTEVQCYVDGSAGGSMCVGARSRMTYLRGAGTPFVFYPYHRPSYTDELGNTFRPIPEIELPDSPALTEQFWANLGGVQPYTYLIKDSVIKQTLAPGNNRSNPWMKIYNTAWVWDNGNKRCRQSMPANAYELVKVVAENLVIEGFRDGRSPEQQTAEFDTTYKQCGYDMADLDSYPTRASWERYGVYTMDGVPE